MAPLKLLLIAFAVAGCVGAPTVEPPRHAAPAEASPRVETLTPPGWENGEWWQQTVRVSKHNGGSAVWVEEFDGFLYGTSSPAGRTITSANDTYSVVGQIFPLAWTTRYSTSLNPVFGNEQTKNLELPLLTWPLGALNSWTANVTIPIEGRRMTGPMGFHLETSEADSFVFSASGQLAAVNGRPQDITIRYVYSTSVRFYSNMAVSLDGKLYLDIATVNQGKAPPEHPCPATVDQISFIHVVGDPDAGSDFVQQAEFHASHGGRLFALHSLMLSSHGIVNISVAGPSGAAMERGLTTAGYTEGLSPLAYAPGTWTTTVRAAGFGYAAAVILEI
jgi:hypothetical protein